jgi:protein SCO1/2
VKSLNVPGFAAIVACSFEALSCAPPPPDPADGLDVPLVTPTGEKIRFHDRIRDQVVLINFMYTKCSGICPRTTHNLVKVQEALGDHLGKDVFIYSISLDPAVDTPSALADYAKELGAKPGWTFLTGSLDDITRLRRSLGLYDRDPAIDADRSEHSGLVVYGNEATFTWAAIPGLADPRRIASAVARVMRPGAQIR